MMTESGYLAKVKSKTKHKNTTSNYIKTLITKMRKTMMELHIE